MGPDVSLYHLNRSENHFKNRTRLSGTIRRPGSAAAWCLRKLTAGLNNFFGGIRVYGIPESEGQPDKTRKNRAETAIQIRDKMPSDRL